MMVAHGLSSTDIAAQLGHANSGITERIYIHQFNSQRTYQRLRQAAQQAMSTNEREPLHADDATRSSAEDINPSTPESAWD